MSIAHMLYTNVYAHAYLLIYNLECWDNRVGNFDRRSMSDIYLL